MYQGSWKNGKRNGFGEEVNSIDNNWLGGQWEMGQLIKGEAKQIVRGSEYLGEWRNGKRDGKGRNVMQSGEVYEGQWV